MKRNMIILGAVLVIGVLFYLTSNSGASITGDSVVDTSKVQNVKLSFKNYEYQLEPSTLEKNVKVIMEVDMKTVSGCMRSVVIPSFGVRKTVSEGDNIIEFVPDKAGEFNIACAMNMGRGKFKVVENGIVSNYVEQALPSSNSCGSSGCGCGGV